MSLTIRPALDSDCRYVYNLSQSVRQWSTRTEAFTYEQHVEWWARRFGPESNQRWWIAEHDGVQVGYVRYGRIVPDEFHTEAQDAAEVSIAIEPSKQTKGIGKELLRETMPLAVQWLKVRRLYALVLFDNRRSHRLFKACGFQYDAIEQRLERMHIRYVWVAPLG